MLISLVIWGQGVPISWGSPYRSYTGIRGLDFNDLFFFFDQVNISRRQVNIHVVKSEPKIEIQRQRV